MENCMFYATRDTSTSTARSRSRIQRTPRMWCRVRLSLTLNSLAGFNRALAPRVHTGRAGNRVFATARDTTEVAGNPAANRKRSPQRRDREYHREKGDCEPIRSKSAADVARLRNATRRQNGPFLPVNTAAVLTGIPERISKSKTSVSALMGSSRLSLLRRTLF